MNNFIQWLKQRKVTIAIITTLIIIIIVAIIGIIKSEPRYWHIKTEETFTSNRGKNPVYMSYSYDKKQELLKVIWNKELTPKQIKAFEYYNPDAPIVEMILQDKDSFRIGNEIKFYTSDCNLDNKTYTCRVKIKQSKENMLQVFSLGEKHPECFDMSDRELLEASWI